MVLYVGPVTANLERFMVWFLACVDITLVAWISFTVGRAFQIEAECREILHDRRP